MATYFYGNSEIQGDGLQTLILMNPGYVGYSDTEPPQPPPGNFVFLNSATSGNSLNPTNLPHAPPHHTQQLIGIPLPSTGPASSQDHHPTSVHSHHQNISSALHGFNPRFQYNIYNAIDPTAERDATRAPQGLSLSLSSQQGSYRAEREVPSQSTVPAISPTRGDDMRVSGGSPSSASAISNGGSGMQSVLLSSKYLKAAQELLDEVVNVGKSVKFESGKGTNGQTAKTIGESLASASSVAVTGEGLSGGETKSELTTAERQEIQMKKAKLLNMLDEVEQRYRQYHHQMQIVISWFEQVAGTGSAKTYTALALQTISKQFRCLKDAITGQIRAASKSLGEEDCLGGGKLEGSRLKFVDHQLRQQRALQQLGMIQHNAWRPQRGLPERAVSVLRAWLFEHFLHPYPKDSDKHLLAKQTGLTRSQVSNWFINARVRLWKPMVEEMYSEEMKDQEQNGSEEKRSKSEHKEDSSSKSIAPQEKIAVMENRNNSFKSKQNDPTNQNTSPVSTSPTGVNFRNQSGFTLIRSPETEGMAQGSPKKPRNAEMLQSPNSVPSMGMDIKASEANNEQMSMNFSNEMQSRDGFTLMGTPTNFIGGFESYPMGEIGRFNAERFPGTYSGNGVSLTLGLPHCENLSISGAHQTFLPNQNIQLGRRLEMGEPNEFGTLNTPTSSHSTTIYDMQNRKSFAAQLLPDFVA
ncbi:BEL1-like homeodomain protein 1 [Cornus florida]|uniref:BEL1-like homeodomain protein 1 n=1 Tax=Cornus florida TaxID=4283 RepID=UPI00289F95CF|nr:BEL1-like homeodomain protein 1 [Cornus florida]XP_059646580.1 BEL1-like homeodomain protein 1 [Cornus florida]XP_059646581.1 BEL1-like homeodomain protein 1 [Cornus florida]